MDRSGPTFWQTFQKQTDNIIEMKITKVELLWSRACPYACAGCAMPLEHPDHQGTVEQWEQGMKNIAAMGSQFVAIYGAEPLTRPVGLVEVIRAIYAVGMKATIITALPKSPLLRRLLETTPLDSITVSWDGRVSADRWREKKSNDGQHVLHAFKNVRDRAVVATVSETNVRDIVSMAEYADSQGFWFLFDLYHHGSGPLSKCNDEGGLQPANEQDVRMMAAGLRELKARGKKIHASDEYLKFLFGNYRGEARSLWHCYKKKTGWLTINSDGMIMPCDDWQVQSGRRAWEDNVHEEIARWRDGAVQACPGCAWNTHFDAVGIEEGWIPNTSYVH